MVVDMSGCGYEWLVVVVDVVEWLGVDVVEWLGVDVVEWLGVDVVGCGFGHLGPVGSGAVGSNGVPELGEGVQQGLQHVPLEDGHQLAEGAAAARHEETQVVLLDAAPLLGRDHEG